MARTKDELEESLGEIGTDILLNHERNDLLDEDSLYPVMSSIKTVSEGSINGITLREELKRQGETLEWFTAFEECGDVEIEDIADDEED